jgi:hypothetical protein
MPITADIAMNGTWQYGSKSRKETINVTEKMIFPSFQVVLKPEISQVLSLYHARFSFILTHCPSVIPPCFRIGSDKVPLQGRFSF